MLHPRKRNKLLRTQLLKHSISCMGYRRIPAYRYSEFNIYNNNLTRTLHVMCYRLFTAYRYSEFNSYNNTLTRTFHVMCYRLFTAYRYSEFNIYNNTLTRTFHVMCYRLFTAYRYSNTIFVTTQLLEHSMLRAASCLLRIAVQNALSTFRIEKTSFGTTTVPK